MKKLNRFLRLVGCVAGAGGLRFGPRTFSWWSGTGSGLFGLIRLRCCDLFVIIEFKNIATGTVA